MLRILQKIHYKVVEKMSESWVVENVLIAKYKDGDEQYDCIYCTIIRVAILFFVIGLVVGYYGS